MTEWAWINGELTPLSHARIGVEDRGFQFADGVYEVIRLYEGRPFTLSAHLDRLERSCAGIELSPPAREAVEGAVEKVLDRSNLTDGMVYLQVTRGVSPRNHLFPPRAEIFNGTLLCYARSLPPLPAAGTAAGVRLITVPDERWRRCWVKSIALLPNVLAKNRAAAAGADEAVFVENGVVSECSASNLFAVIDGRLITHPVGPKVLPGITRAVLLELAGCLGIPHEERVLQSSEAESAPELFITSTTREISWVARWDGRPVGAGGCGPVTLRLHRALQQRVRGETGRTPEAREPASPAGAVDSCPAGV